MNRNAPITIEAEAPIKELSFEAKMAIDTFLRHFDLIELVDSLAEDAAEIVFN